MTEHKDHAQRSRGGITRRNWLKGVATLPVFGLFGAGTYSQQQAEAERKSRILRELGLTDDFAYPEKIPVNLSTADRIRIGIIGFGARGEQIARALGYASSDWTDRLEKQGNLEGWLEQDDLNVAITGICDVFDNHAEKGVEVSDCRYRPTRIRARRYRTYKELLASDDIDAVVICTPDFHHARMTIDAADAGKHVYCEKCMTRTEEEVFAVESAVRDSKVVFQLGHQYHQNSAFIQAKNVMANNVLGKITLYETTSNRNSPHGAWVRHVTGDGRLKPGSPDTIDWQQWLGGSPHVPFDPERFYNWTLWWAYATGLSGQLMSHELDTANQLLDLGVPESCSASGGIYFYKDGREIPDIFNAVFEYPDKDISFIYSASLASDRDRGRVIMGHDASMVLGNSLEISVDRGSTQYQKEIESGLIDPSQPALAYNPSSDRIDALTTASEKYYASRGLYYTYRAGKRVDTTHLHLREWLDAIRHSTPVSCPIEKGVEVTIACHMATRAYREQRRVFWDPAKRRII